MTTTEFVFGATNALHFKWMRHTGNLLQERVVFRAVRDCNLMSFLLLDAHRTGPDTLNDLNRYVFWFPDWEVERGDWVRLYSREGTPNTRQAGGHTYHNLFWGKSRPIWVGDATAAALIEVAAWSMMSRLTRPPQIR